MELKASDKIETRILVVSKRRHWQVPAWNWRVRHCWSIEIRTEMITSTRVFGTPVSRVDTGRARIWRAPASPPVRLINVLGARRMEHGVLRVPTFPLLGMAWRARPGRAGRPLVQIFPDPTESAPPLGYNHLVRWWRWRELLRQSDLLKLRRPEHGSSCTRSSSASGDSRTIDDGWSPGGGSGNDESLTIRRTAMLGTGDLALGPTRLLGRLLGHLGNVYQGRHVCLFGVDEMKNI